MVLGELDRFVLASEARIGIIETLGEEEAIPSEMSIKLNMQPSQISRALRELEERELIKCSTSETKKEKIYTLTDRGDHVRKSFTAFWEKRFLNEIMEALDEKKIPYARNQLLDGEIVTYHPDLVIFKGRQLGQLVLTVEILGQRLPRRSRKPHKFDLSFFIDRLEHAAFSAHDLKKSTNMKFGVGFSMISKAKPRISEPLSKEIEDIIERFIEVGYFDYVFFNDEIDGFISYVEELTRL